jgi:hypothetical protein
MTENWKPVVGYEGLYEVSDLGRVKSLLGRYGNPERILKLQSNNKGYPYAFLYKDKVATNKPVHILVLEAFVSPRPVGMTASHVLNNDPSDVRLCNLAWEPHNANCLRKLEHGTDQKGVRHNLHKLNDDDVRQARSLYQEGLSQRKLAKMFGVAQSTMWALLNKHNWSHVN